jgi:hypothetical protein
VEVGQEKGCEDGQEDVDMWGASRVAERSFEEVKCPTLREAEQMRDQVEAQMPNWPPPFCVNKAIRE